MPIFSVLARLYAYRSLVLLLLLGIAAGLVYYYYHQSIRLQTEKQSIINLYAADTAKVRTRDAAGRETVRVLAPTISPAVLRQVRAGLAAEMREQLRAEFGKQAQLIGATRVATQTRQQLPTVRLRDTLVSRPGPRGPVRQAARAGVFRDPWLTLTGIVTDDSLQVAYTIKNEFDVRAYSKRTGKRWWYFWTKRKVYVDLKNKNPHTTTTKLEAVLIKKE